MERFKEQHLSEALEDENLCKRFDELLRLDRDCDRLKGAVADAPEFLKKSIKNTELVKANADKAKVRISFLKGAVALALVALLIIWPYWQIEQKNRRLLIVYAIATEIQNALNNKPWFETWDGPKVPLLKLNNVITKENDINNKGILNEELPEFVEYIYTHFFEDKLKKADQIKLQTESTAIRGLRKVLLANVWIDQNPDKDTLPNNVVDKPIECTKLIGFRAYKEKKETKARFYQKNVEGFDNYGLVVLKPNNDNMIILWGQIDKENNCTTDWNQELIRTAGDAMVGFGKDLNEMLITEQDTETEKSTRFYTILWPSKEPKKTNQVTSLPLPIITESINLEAITQIDKDHWPVFLKTNQLEFAHEVKYGDRWFRFFDKLPRLINKVGFEPAGINVEKNNNMETCQGLTKKLFEEPNDIFLKITFNEKDPQTFCLRLQLKNNGDSSSSYTGTLYRLNDPNNPTAIPLIADLYFGENPPEKVDIDNNYIRFKSGKIWFEQPWSSDAWQVLANKVLKGKAKIQQTPMENQLFSNVDILFNLLDDTNDH